MRSRLSLAFLFVCASRTAIALTCGGFSIVPADHVVVKYSVALPTGAARSAPVLSVNGTDITVTRTVSGGSATDGTCADDVVDLYLGAGRFNLTWIDNVNFTSQRATFAFSVGAPDPEAATNTLSYHVEVFSPTLPGQSVRLITNAALPAPDVAYVSGNDIQVSQYGTGQSRKHSVIDLGILAAGLYNVTWSWALPSGAQATGSFRFVVQQPPPSAPCSGAARVTRTADGTSRLRYEGPYYGYSPAFGPPAVTDLGETFNGVSDYPSLMTVNQPIADVADPSAPGAARFSTICHAEEVSLGPVDDGFHWVYWYQQLSVNGSDHGIHDVDIFGFRSHNGASQCTTAGELLAPSPALEGVPFQVAVNIAFVGWETGAKVAVNGQTITLDFSSYFEGDPDTLPNCQPYKATVGALPAGEYTVLWRIQGGGYRSSHLTVAKPTRLRAAHH